jgi:hypothetical protein
MVGMTGQNKLRRGHVAFRIIWRNVSELFGVVSALRRNASQTEAATNMAAIHKQNQIFTSLSEQLSVLAKGHLSFHVGRPDSAVRQIAPKHYAT